MGVGGDLLEVPVGLLLRNPLRTSNQGATIEIHSLQMGLAAKEAAAHGEAASSSFKPSKIRLNIA
jgi:hypothetical protein